jgi:N-acetylglutamate synthase-like GNAT family acetyltransferase
VSVRKAVLKDIKKVLAVIDISNAEAYKKIIPEKYFKEPVFTHDEFLEKFREMTFYVYEQNGEIAGAAALQTESEGLGYVRFVYILPKHQRKGIGTRLVAHIEIEARRLGLKTLKVPHVDTNAHWAINFYMKLGYNLVDKRKKPWGYDLFFEKML